MSTPLLEVSDLRVFHDVTEVVHGVSFKIAPDKVSAILGVNGAGKTALALAIAGLLRATGGVSFDGVPIQDIHPWQRSHLGIALVQEGRRLFHNLTVGENLGLATWRRGKSRADMVRQLGFVHDLFPVLKRKDGEPSSRLSGGEQQMLAVGQGLMAFPRLLILDEPTAGLAPKIVSEMLTAINTLSQEGYTAIVIDQSVANIRRVADDVIIMKLGHIVKTLTAADVDDAVISEFVA